MSSSPITSADAGVLSLAELGQRPIAELLSHYGLRLCPVESGEAIPGSFWGDSEAGLIRDTVYAREDTPVHSILHESAHYVCMDSTRRKGLHTDAGGDDLEEVAVCYLQVLLADRLPGLARARMLADMDRWGYSFRLGSAAAWLASDAEDARRWLLAHGLIDEADRPTWRLRA